VLKSLNLIAPLAKEDGLTDGQIEQIFIIAGKAIGFRNTLITGDIIKMGIECITPLVARRQLSVDQIVTLTGMTIEKEYRAGEKKGPEFISSLIARGPLSDKQIVHLVMCAIRAYHKYDTAKALELIPLLQEKDTLLHSLREELFSAGYYYQIKSNIEKIIIGNYLSKKELLAFAEKLLMDPKEYLQEEFLGENIGEFVILTIMSIEGIWEPELQNIWQSMLQKQESREWMQQFINKNISLVQALPGSQFLLSYL